MKARLLQAMQRHPSGMWPEGAIIDDPEAVILVQLGAAVPADDECEEAHGLTAEQLEAAQRAYARVSAGIHPDDYAEYDAGEMIGYDADGNKIPGPNKLPEPQEESYEW